MINQKSLSKEILGIILVQYFAALQYLWGVM